MRSWVLTIIFLIPLFSTAQVVYRQLENGEIGYKSSITPRKKNNKKNSEILREWASNEKNLTYATLKSDDEKFRFLEFKASTKVPSVKQELVIIYKLRFNMNKKTLEYRISDFYIEEIEMSLDDWYEKYKTSDRKRMKRNVKFVTEGLDANMKLMIASFTKELGAN